MEWPLRLNVFLAAIPTAIPLLRSIVGGQVKVASGFVPCFVSQVMAYFALPPQSVPIRIVNPAARVASPDGASTQPVNLQQDGRDTPKAVIGEVLAVFASRRQTQSYYRLVPANVSQSTYPRVRSLAPRSFPFQPHLGSGPVNSRARDASSSTLQYVNLVLDHQDTTLKCPL